MINELGQVSIACGPIQDINDSVPQLLLGRLEEQPRQRPQVMLASQLHQR